jgi:hypothetical protein
MQFDWSTLGAKSPTNLIKARQLSHHALQWVTKAARANLEAVPDDSHSALEWDGERGVLFSQPLPTAAGVVRVGLRLGGLALVVMRDKHVLDTYELAGRRDSMVGVWFDSALRALGLKPAGEVTLPYSIPSHPVARGTPYHLSGEAEALDELARWFAAAADLLADVKVMHAGAGAIVCWPHHFDIATLVSFDAAGENARSIGVGVSPGDEYYPQPYVYISASPKLAVADLPLLPPPGHWHTEGFVGAVATAGEILMLDDRGPVLSAFVNAAFDIGRARLGV